MINTRTLKEGDEFISEKGFLGSVFSVDDDCVMVKWPGANEMVSMYTHRHDMPWDLRPPVNIIPPGTITGIRVGTVEWRDSVPDTATEIMREYEYVNIGVDWANHDKPIPKRGEHLTEEILRKAWEAMAVSPYPHLTEKAGWAKPEDKVLCENAIKRILDGCHSVDPKSGLRCGKDPCDGVHHMTLAGTAKWESQREPSVERETVSTMGGTTLRLPSLTYEEARRVEKKRRDRDIAFALEVSSFSENRRAWLPANYVRPLEQRISDTHAIACLTSIVERKKIGPQQTRLKRR